MSNLPKCQHEDKADGWVNRKMCKIKKRKEKGRRDNMNKEGTY